MKLFEYQAKRIFKESGIPVPDGRVCSTEMEVRDAFAQVGRGKEAVLKSQVLTGGRGKAGGIQFSGSFM